MGLKGFSSGVNIPGFLNTCNSPSPTGYQDQFGNPFYMGLTAGKMISLGPNEANNVAAPGSGFVGDGVYQWVQLDSGATAANATEGLAAYIKLDSGLTQGALPETAYGVPTVTTEDQAVILGLIDFFCGVFINPATYQGQPNGPTPGNWCFIFVGGGRVQVQYDATVAGLVGAQVIPDSGATIAGAFKAVAAGSAAYTMVPAGIAATAPVASTVGLAYYSEIIYRIPF